MPETSAWAIILSQILPADGSPIYPKEADQKFMDLVMTMRIPLDVQRDAFSCWLKCSEHEPRVLPPVTEVEYLAIYYVAVAIVGSTPQ